MPLQRLLRMPTDSARGELSLVDPAERPSYGYFELHNPARPLAPKLKLYFTYDHPPKISLVFHEEHRRSLYDELINFFNTVTSIQPLGPYVLKMINIPMGEPLVFN